ncbi:ABC transporter [Lentzea guizhouensis]|uniref:ABC transporter n=1 Tax=Lentzea guizhouensis TaxID=1586287 RepID=A0A1B2HZY5_9PSEU|nr:ATP-binding cassette domain-containing protein [Lentzea guizhouensis]ANZ43263.1 ABC transporter [Lentzea guizhouensis]
MIFARGLRKSFGDVDAVRGVDLDVAPGEVVGLLGPNGAGKTTTLRMLTTLLRPTSGTAVVAGADLLAEPALVRSRIGYVAQSGGTEPRCRVLEELEFQADLYRVPRSRGAELCEVFGLSGLERRTVATLSGGQRRKLDIALGLVHSPALLLLDEPSLGLDPASRDDLWAHLRALPGTTVVLTTHYLDEADALCDRVLVVDHGAVVASGTPASLKRQLRGDVITLEVSGGVSLLESHPLVHSVAVSGSSVRLTVADGSRALVSLLRVLDDAGFEVSSVELHQPTLDDVFRAVTGRSLELPGRVVVG